MKKIYNTVFKVFVLGILISIFFIFSAFWYFSYDLPDYKKLSSYEPSVLSRVYDDKGQLIAEYALEKRLFIPYESIPNKFIYSFLSAEDKNFFDHLVSMLGNKSIYKKYKNFYEQRVRRCLNNNSTSS